MTSDPYHVLVVKLRHAELKAVGLCINGSLTGEPSRRTGRMHGAAYRGGRCKACWTQKLERERLGLRPDVKP